MLTLYVLAWKALTLWLILSGLAVMAARTRSVFWFLAFAAIYVYGADWLFG